MTKAGQAEVDMARESGKVMPTKISREAWSIAMVIDEEVASLFSEYGIHRREGRSKTTEVIAKMVQLAINQHQDRVNPL